jgi:hypothetical protein
VISTGFVGQIRYVTRSWRIAMHVLEGEGDLRKT